MEEDNPPSYEELHQDATPTSSTATNWEPRVESNGGGREASPSTATNWEPRVESNGGGRDGPTSTPAGMCSIDWNISPSTDGGLVQDDGSIPGCPDSEPQPYFNEGYEEHQDSLPGTSMGRCSSRLEPQSYINESYEEYQNYETTQDQEPSAPPLEDPDSPPMSPIIPSRRFRPRVERPITPRMIHVHKHTTPPIIPRAPDLVIPRFPALSHQEIRNACNEYVNSTACYGREPILEMKFINVISTCSLHYRLESYTERRQFVKRYSQFHGEEIDGPENDPPLSPSDVTVNVITMFKDSSGWVKIPHTEYLEPCEKCSGSGKDKCSTCKGRGTINCSSCHMGKIRNDKFCPACRGTGRRKCFCCIGMGKEVCKTCTGVGKLKYYKMLIVTRKNNVDDFVKNPFHIPNRHILKAKGRILLKEENPTVTPTYTSDEYLNLESFDLLNKHKREFSNQDIIMQRQILRVIPVTKVNYTWREKFGEFYIYSDDNIVLFERYPQESYCCVCF